MQKDGKKEYSTAARSLMLSYLQEHKNRGVPVADLAEYLKKEGHETNLTTIYRYLDKLDAQGSVMKYTSPKGDCTVYQYVEAGGGCAAHLHMQCLGCGKIYHLSCGFMDEISHHILKDHGFVINCRESVLCGYCAACQDSSGSSIQCAT